jgi:antitoxin (DNA-binding transcriptional repressor) of toxin-antitoxin stability system
MGVVVTVGVRELKNRLRHYLRRVRVGDVVVVTDRGDVVAELRQPTFTDGPTPYAAVNRQIAAGTISEGRLDPPADLYSIDEGIPIPGPALERLLDDERSEG